MTRKPSEMLGKYWRGAARSQVIDKMRVKGRLRESLFALISPANTHLALDNESHPAGPRNVDSRRSLRRANQATELPRRKTGRKSRTRWRRWWQPRRSRWRSRRSTEQCPRTEQGEGGGGNTAISNRAEGRGGTGACGQRRGGVLDLRGACEILLCVRVQPSDVPRLRAEATGAIQEERLHVL